MIDKAALKLGPPVLEGLFSFGMTEVWIAGHVGVSGMTVSRWYRGMHGMKAEHALLLTKLLERTIQSAEEALEGTEIPDAWRAGMEQKLRTARGWYALQDKLNGALPPEDRAAEMALYEARTEALEKAPQEPTGSGPWCNRSPQKHETHAPELGGKGVGFGSHLTLSTEESLV